MTDKDTVPEKKHLQFIILLLEFSLLLSICYRGKGSKGFFL